MLLPSSCVRAIVSDWRPRPDCRANLHSHSLRSLPGHDGPFLRIIREGLEGLADVLALPVCGCPARL